MRGLLGFKVAIVGGTTEALTLRELREILSYHFVSVARIFIDLKYVGSKLLDEGRKRDFNNLIITDLNVLRNSIDQVYGNNPVLAVHSIEAIVNSFVKDPTNRRNLINTAKALKSAVLPIHNEFYSVSDLLSTFDYGNIFFQILNYSYDFKNFIKLKNPPGREKRALDALTVKLKKSIEDVIHRGMAFPGGTRIDLVRFLEEIDQTTQFKNFNSSTAIDLIPLKRVILGGDRRYLGHHEVMDFLDKLPTMSMFAYELITTKTDNLKLDILFQEVFLKNIRRFRDQIIYPFRAQEDVISVKEILSMLQHFIPEGSSFDPKNFKRTIIDFKERIISKIPRDQLSYDETNPESRPNDWKIDSTFNQDDIKILFTILENILQSALFANTYYDYHRTVLESEPDLIAIAKFPRLQNSSLFTSNFFKEGSKDFYETSRKQKYFRFPDSSVPFYGQKVMRNQSGFVESMVIRSALKNIIVGYGPEEEKTLETAGLNVKQVQAFLVGIKSVLQEFGLWTRSFSTFANNTLLLGDLFQSLSDGNFEINIDEATEYAVLIIAAAAVLGQLMEAFEQTCGHRIYEFNGVQEKRYDYACVNKNLFPIFLFQLNKAEFFPQLAEFVEMDKDGNDAGRYIQGVETFARDADMVGKDWRERGIILVMGAMFNIESTFLRFDTNFDNFIVNDELSKAFEVYKGALAQLTGLNDILNKRAFYFMLKNMRRPVGREIFSPIGDIEAKRVNIGALLAELVAEKRKEALLLQQEKAKNGN